MKGAPPPIGTDRRRVLLVARNYRAALEFARERRWPPPGGPEWVYVVHEGVLRGVAPDTHRILVLGYPDTPEGPFLRAGVAWLGDGGFIVEDTGASPVSSPAAS